MANQFVHIEAYSRTGSKKKNGGVSAGNTWTAAQILAEAMRNEGHCDHVKNPQTPEIIYGISAEELLEECETWFKEARDPKGRKMRPDALCLLAGVASLCRDDEENFEEFKTRNVEHFKKIWGDQLRCVIAHDDEAHPHIHFYVVPKIGARFDSVHPGFKAKRLARENGKKNKLSDAATLKAEMHDYKEAMVGFLDVYHQGVGIPMGMARIGPRLQRLPTGVYKAQQRQRDANRIEILAAEKAKIEEAAAKIEEAKAKIEEAAAKKRAVEICEEATKRGKKMGLKQAKQEQAEPLRKLAGVFGFVSIPDAKLKKALVEEKQRNEQKEKDLKAAAVKKLDALNADRAKIQKQLLAVKLERDNLADDIKRAEAEALKFYESAEFYKQQLKQEAPKNRPSIS